MTGDGAWRCLVNEYRVNEEAASAILDALDWERVLEVRVKYLDSKVLLVHVAGYENYQIDVMDA